jgi:hypothetical protein
MSGKIGDIEPHKKKQSSQMKYENSNPPSSKPLGKLSYLQNNIFEVQVHFPASPFDSDRTYDIQRCTTKSKVVSVMYPLNRSFAGITRFG